VILLVEKAEIHHVGRHFRLTRAISFDSIAARISLIVSASFISPDDHERSNFPDYSAAYRDRMDAAPRCEAIPANKLLSLPFSLPLIIALETRYSLVSSEARVFAFRSSAENRRDRIADAISRVLES